VAKRYTDRQMALILKRAAERQAEGADASHSLADIQQIAQQVGIDASLIAEAALTIRDRDGQPGEVLGPSAAYRVSRRLESPGVPIDSAALLEVIRDRMPDLGESRPLPDGFEWYSGPAENKTFVSVTTRSDGTTVRIDGRQSGPKIGLYLLAGTVTIVAGGVVTVAAPVVGVGVAAGLFVATFGAARAAWSAIARRSRARAEQLVDALAERIARHPPDEAK
jgi:hypothetical protein